MFQVVVHPYYPEKGTLYFIYQKNDRRIVKLLLFFKYFLLTELFNYTFVAEHR